MNPVLLAIAIEAGLFVLGWAVLIIAATVASVHPSGANAPVYKVVARVSLVVIVVSFAAIFVTLIVGLVQAFT